MIVVVWLLPLLIRAARSQAWSGFSDKTLWDWLQLLIVPLVLVIGGFLLTTLQDARQRAIEDQRAQDTALQAYLDQMGNFLLEKDLRTSKEDSEVRTLARARTLTMLARMDPSRRQDVMQFLVEAELVQEVEGRGPIIGLSDAQLRDVDLFSADLRGADLRNADLSGVYLEWTKLSGANLSYAMLNNAAPFGLGYTDLYSAKLSEANLHGAELSYANLHGANLHRAGLRDAKLIEADLSEADLSYANLSNASRWTEKQLTAAATLEGAAMPNGEKVPTGRKYDDWLKDFCREQHQCDL
jgi:uncharacterized protein YjbI with pentapeptide repeats